MPRLQVNGRAVEVPEALSLGSYLEQLGVDARAVAVERNGEIEPRDTYGSCLLSDGDVLEIVRMVGGG